MGTLRTMVWLVVGTLAIGGFIPGGATGQEPEEQTPCGAEFVDVPGQGLSRRHASGLWEVCLSDGTTLFSHGPDGPEIDVGVGGGFGTMTTSRAPSCVGATTWHNHAIYAVPSDKTDRYSTQESVVRGYIHQADAKLYDEGQLFGATIDYKFTCSGGQAIISHAVLPTASTSDTFSTIASDLRALGFTNTLAKYWVWYDDGVGGYCGQGSIWNDDRLLSSNSNNFGNIFAVTYACGWSTMMHENGHNLGAVQLSAPNTSGAWHCNDDKDIMCYNDGGSNSGGYNPNVCGIEHFDCNNNDYFHPSPTGGSYLATHWNLGGLLNRFFQFAAITGAPSNPQNLVAVAGQRTTVSILTITNQPTRLSWDAPATLNGGPVTDYWVYRTPPSGTEVVLARIAGEIRTFSDLGYTVSGTYTYRVTAINGAGESSGAVATADVTVTDIL